MTDTAARTADLPPTAFEPIRKAIHIDRSIDHVFETFVGRVGAWWPIATHSIGIDRVVDLVHERHAGGRFFERLEDGTEYTWGRILAFDPPHRVVYAWDPSPVPREPTEVEVRFTALDGHRTRVELEHRGWERIGERAIAGRISYETGWDVVLGRFVADVVS